MIVEKQFNEALEELQKLERSTITIGDHIIFMQTEQGASLITLSCCVYRGLNYIPTGVREAMKHLFPKPRPFHTDLYLDEKSHTINLLFRGKLEGVSKKRFLQILEEFVLIAEDWIDWFDDHDKRDRIHIRRK